MRFSYFYKMAVRNIKANRQLYVPYMVSAVATVGMFLQMMTVMSNDFSQFRGGNAVKQMLSFGSIVIAIFSVIFLLYANSFLIKKRKKEIGLYGILGLEKKHVAKILFVETILVTLATLALGTVVGLVFGRLCFFLLNYLLRMPAEMAYHFHWPNLLLTIGLFMAIFLLAYLYNVSQVTFSNPIHLLKGQKEGEKEPKSNLFLFLLGLVTLGAGYFISVTISDPLAALIQFFLAVLLVIIGTYLLFTSGSIFILKAMKKNKKIYYQPRGFISISGMLYRMKQNAAGLANITILSCMVMIALGTTVSIYVGAETALASRYPTDNAATIYYDEEISVPAIEADMATAIDMIVAEKEDLEITDFKSYPYANIFGYLIDGRFEGSRSFASDIKTLVLVALDDFNAMEGLNLTLSANQVYIHEKIDYPVDSHLDLAGIDFEVLRFNDSVESFGLDQDFGMRLFVILPNRQAVDQVVQAYQVDDSTSVSVSGLVQWNTTGDDQQKAAYAERLRPRLETDEIIVRYETRQEGRAEWFAMNGSFLFLGIFLSLLFMLGTILITYFKQISEGYDDRERFQIMQKVGLDKDMIRSTSRSQVVWMFMLPVIVATIHIAFAYPMVHKLLFIFDVTSHVTLLSCLAAVIVAFSLLYWLIYRLTARIYYSIVQ